MNFICQQEAMSQLKSLAEHQQHGVLIVGDPGSGKTYMARQYAKFLRISDFYLINPAVSDLRTMIDTCIDTGNPVVMCIENLDNGVVQAAYPLLKLIEDCPKHIYIVVTCNNYYAIPDTIPSRCALVTVNPPTRSDIDQYAKFKNEDAFDRLHENHLWSCVRGFSDADTALGFNTEQLNYFKNLQRMLPFKDTVSNISWKLQHFEDRSETPLPLVLRYLMRILGPGDQSVCIECLNDLAENRISKNAIVSKLVFELKYTK